MIENLNPYPEYKDSGLPWLGQVPAHWEIRRGKSLFSESNLPVRDGDEIVTCFRDGQVTLRKNRRTSGFMTALYEAGYQGVRTGQLVIHAMDAFAGAIGISDSDGKCTPEYIVLDPLSNSAHPSYFSQLLRHAARQQFILVQCPAVRERAPRFRYPNFGCMWMPLPPASEQAAIASFLAWATNRLDRAIGAKRRIIALLQEQKQAIIHRAVTRGLDPSEPLKDSGIPWLGEIPEHWEVRKIRAVASRVTKGTTPTTLGKQFVASGIRFVKVESISANRNILEWKCAFIDDATDRLLSRSKLRANDVVVSIAGAIGRPAIISPSLLPANTNQAVGIISPLNHLCRSEWLTYVLASPMCLRSLSESSVQTAQANLSLTSLGRAAIGLPHVHEQDMIVARLSIVVSSVANTISRLEREIDLIREYRTRLIADVVTGKLDVREAAAGLPEPDNASDQRLEPEEEEPEFEAEDAQKESTD